MDEEEMKSQISELEGVIYELESDLKNKEIILSKYQQLIREIYDDLDKFPDNEQLKELKIYMDKFSRENRIYF